MIRYAGPIIDAHHHIWMRKDVAWLRDPPIIRAIGDFFGLRRDIPVEEWVHDVVPEGVTKSVHVTANWGPGRGLDETRWPQGVADKHGFPHGIVAQADLADPDVETQIKAHKQFPNVRGIRHQLHWDSAPLRRKPPANSPMHPPASAAPRTGRPSVSAGFKGVHIPYKGGLDALTEVFAGRVDFACMGLSSALSFIQNKQLVALAVSKQSRSKALPDVPTTLEAGYKDSDYNYWNGFLLPAATPRRIVEKLYETTKKVLALPDVMQKFEPQGIEPMPVTPVEFDAIIKKEIADNKALVKAIGLTPT